ncbi:MAG: 7-cyano-7-deazaguanine synthase QueC [Fidelibacterota bacterium]
MKKAIILLSGGLDSATCLAIAQHMGYELYALSFNYGQRHNFELNSAKNIAHNYSVKKHKIIKIDLQSFGHSALTDNIDVPKDALSKEESIPVTYVPARNTIFLSYAMAWAEILPSSHIFIGVNALDYSGYPDCRPDYIEAYQNMANLAMKTVTETGQPIKIHTPLLTLTKSGIIQRGLSLGVDYSLTHSCYDPNESGESCGHCDACLLRKKGFKEAGVEDPIIYQD